MTQARSDVVAALATRFPSVGQRKTEAAVLTLLETIAQALVENRRVELRGFGSFSPKSHAPRTGRNPKTGEAVVVSAHRTVRFKLGKPLQVNLNIVPLAS